MHTSGGYNLVPPIDDLDYVFMLHDMAYGSGKNVVAADLDLIGGALSTVDGVNMKSLAAVASAAGFSVKAAAQSVPAGFSAAYEMLFPTEQPLEEPLEVKKDTFSSGVTRTFSHDEL